MITFCLICFIRRSSLLGTRVALTYSISSQVRSLSTFLEMEGYDRTPFSTLQLESFHRQVTQRLEQEKETVSQVMVRNAHFDV